MLPVTEIVNQLCTQATIVKLILKILLINKESVVIIVKQKLKVGIWLNVDTQN